MGYLAVNKDGSEIISRHLPERSDLSNEWVDLYEYTNCGGNQNDIEIQIELPQGTIKKLIGKELTWNDEPIKLQ